MLTELQEIKAIRTYIYQKFKTVMTCQWIKAHLDEYHVDEDGKVLEMNVWEAVNHTNKPQESKTTPQKNPFDLPAINPEKVKKTANFFTIPVKFGKPTGQSSVSSGQSSGSGGSAKALDRIELSPLGYEPSELPLFDNALSIIKDKIKFNNEINCKHNFANSSVCPSVLCSVASNDDSEFELKSSKSSMPSGLTISEERLKEIEYQEFWFTEEMPSMPENKRKTQFYRQNCLQAIRAYLLLEGVYFGALGFIDQKDYTKIKSLFKRHYKGWDKSKILKSHDFPQLAYFAILPKLKKQYRIHFHYKQLDFLERLFTL